MSTASMFAQLHSIATCLQKTKVFKHMFSNRVLKIWCDDESCHRYGWVTSQIWMTESTLSIGEWEMSRVYMSHVTHINGSRHSYGWFYPLHWRNGYDCPLCGNKCDGASRGAAMGGGEALRNSDVNTCLPIFDFSALSIAEIWTY